jgi:hypothetical protein
MHLALAVIAEPAWSSARRAAEFGERGVEIHRLGRPRRTAVGMPVDR